MTNSIRNLKCVERCIHFSEIDSTNTYAKNRVQAGDCRGEGITVITAGKQIAGRGRGERSFFSSVEGGLWVSLIVQINNLDCHFEINRTLSVALCESVGMMAPGASLGIKWPNDIFWGDKKLCGILLETAKSPQNKNYLIAGFGLNVNIPRQKFPQSLLSIATSMLIETNRRYDIFALLKNIISSFEKLRHLSSNSTHKLYSRLLYKTGHRIQTEKKEGIFDSVDKNGFLILDTGKRIERISSGTIRFLD